MVSNFPTYKITILIDDQLYSARNAKAADCYSALKAVLLRVLTELHYVETEGTAVSVLGRLAQLQLELDKLVEPPDLT